MGSAVEKLKLCISALFGMVIGLTMAVIFKDIDKTLKLISVIAQVGTTGTFIFLIVDRFKIKRMEEERRKELLNAFNTIKNIKIDNSDECLIFKINAVYIYDNSRSIYLKKAISYLLAVIKDDSKKEIDRIKDCKSIVKDYISKIDEKYVY